MIGVGDIFEYFIARASFMLKFLACLSQWHGICRISEQGEYQKIFAFIEKGRLLAFRAFGTIKES